MFEHPRTTMSPQWYCVGESTITECARTSNLDSCMLGWASHTGCNTGHANARTTVLTNLRDIAPLPRDVQCRNEHRHHGLIIGHPGKCQEHLDKSATAIREGATRDLDGTTWWYEMSNAYDAPQPFGNLIAVHDNMDAMSQPGPMAVNV